MKFKNVPPNIEWKYGKVPLDAKQGEYLLFCISIEEYGEDPWLNLAYFYDGDLDTCGYICCVSRPLKANGGRVSPWLN